MDYYLWIGSYVDDSVYEYMRGLGYKNPASYLSQKNLLEAIEAVTGVQFDVLSVLTMDGYPKDRTLNIPKRQFGQEQGSSRVMVGYLNIMYLNRLFSIQAIKRETQEWLKLYKNDGQLYIFIYEMRSCCLSALEIIKKKIKNAKAYLIVPDLPQFMDLSMNGLKKTLKKYDWKRIERRLGLVDKFILYAAPMAELLKLDKEQWMLMEGTIDAREITPIKKLNGSRLDKTVIMYSGSTQLGFGIEKLLQAFDILDDHYELWITGTGDARKLIEEYASRNRKIKYYGFLDTREEVAAFQQKATALINMRDPHSPASDFCFPSKLFEYMLSGKPVLSFKQGGIPEEYYKYIRTISDFSSDGIAQAIIDLREAGDNENERRGSAGRQFIIENKTNISQARRIIDFTTI